MHGRCPFRVGCEQGLGDVTGIEPDRGWPIPGARHCATSLFSAEHLGDGAYFVQAACCFGAGEKMCSVNTPALRFLGFSDVCSVSVAPFRMFT